MRSRRRALLALLVGLSAVLAVPEPAVAAAGDLSCSAIAQADMVPPLDGLTTQATAHVRGALVNCVSANHNFPNLRSATVEGTGDATALAGVPCALLLHRGHADLQVVAARLGRQPSGLQPQHEPG